MVRIDFHKRVLILGSIIALLAITYALGLVFSPARVRAREAQEPVFSTLDKASVSSIQLTRGASKLLLNKEGSDWALRIDGKSYSASAGRVSSFLDFLKTLKRFRAVSANPETWKDFQVTEAEAIRIRLLDSSEKALADLLVGKAAAGSRGEYLRLQGGNEVLLSDKSMSFYLNLETPFWSRLRLLPDKLEARDLIRISLRSRLRLGDNFPDLDYTLVLGEGSGDKAWKVQGGKGGENLAADQVDRLATAIVEFEGVEYALDVDERAAGLEPPVAELVISTRQNQEYRLRVGKVIRDKSQYYVKVAGSPFIYRAAEWRIQGIVKKLEDLAATGEKK